MKYRSRRQCGQTLLEVLVGILVLAIVLATGIGLAGSAKPGELSRATSTFDAMLDLTREDAASSGNGATLSIIPNTNNTSFSAYIYAGRPNGVQMSKTPIRSETFPIGFSSTVGGTMHATSSALAIFVNSVGNVSWTSWQMSKPITILTSEPTCDEASPLTLIFTLNKKTTVTDKIYCDDARVVPLLTQPTPRP